MNTFDVYPAPSKERLNELYLGKSLQDVSLPSAILDLAKLKRNCSLMLGAVKELDVGFRAHVKTHKTIELTYLQVGEETKDVRLICSTVVELEQLAPLLKHFQARAATVNVLYGVPPGLSHGPRLSTFLRDMGPGTLSLMIDHPSQLALTTQIYNATRHVVKVFIKTDSGYHRAGLAPTSTTMQDLVKATLSLETQGHLELLGFYSHNSLSYGGDSPLEAMDNLRTEIDACTQAALTNCPVDYISARRTPLTISCGASPTALSLQNLLQTSTDTRATTSADALRSSLDQARKSNIHFEIHAGVYPTLDMQQVSASSRHMGPKPEDAIAFTVLSEICSTYPDRTECPEALINAGTIALAREPCKSYRGQGVVTGWNMSADYDPYTLEKRMIVDRVSQEHGLLQWEDKKRRQELPVECGQRVRLWPNHACITGSQFGWYLIVDSDSDDGNIVRDVWIRWRGW